MLTISVSQAQKYDYDTINHIGIPAMVLMERAALKSITNIQDIGWEFKKVLIVAGSGNNGGDGLAIGRLLSLQGYEVIITLLGNPKHYSEQHQKQLLICKHYHIPIKSVEEIDWNDIDLIVDAIFGIGLSRPVTGNYRNVINKINKNQAQVFSVDVPSGLNADTGETMGISVNANATATFAYLKRGMIADNREILKSLGRLFVDDIGVYAPDQY